VATTPQEHLRNDLTYIDHYIVTMLRFLEHNLEHAMLRSHSPPKQT
jgi:hypothetical protein